MPQGKALVSIGTAVVASVVVARLLGQGSEDCTYNPFTGGWTFVHPYAGIEVEFTPWGATYEDFFVHSPSANSYWNGTLDGGQGPIFHSFWDDGDEHTNNDPGQGWDPDTQYAMDFVNTAKIACSGGGGPS